MSGEKTGLREGLLRGQGEPIGKKAQRVKIESVRVQYCGNSAFKRKFVENQNLWQSRKSFIALVCRL